MERTLEPEIMDDAEQVAAYAEADFAASNQWFVDRVTADFPGHLRNVLDIGCGPGDVVIRLAQAQPDIHITAVDGSRNMLDIAAQRVAAAGLTAQITLHRGRIPNLSLDSRLFDAVLSKDLLHHLPDPQVLWREVRRLGRPGAGVVVMDLVRPATAAAARHIVESVAPDEAPVLKTDFFNSLCASFTIAEVTEQVRRAGLPLHVVQVSERHMLIHGFLPATAGETT